MEYQDSALWARTLGAVNPGTLQTQVAQLKAAFEQFRRHVEPLAAEIALSVPGYTDHSVSHCDALWDTAGLIVGTDFPLNPAEAFVLGGAFLVHDLAMGLSAYREGLRGILDSPEWFDLLCAEHPGESSELQQIALRDTALDPTWNGLTSPAVKASLTTFLRESHARQAEAILATEWRLSNGESFYLLPDTELRHWYGDVIGKIARSHWLDVSDLEDFLRGVLGTPSNFPLEWTVDPVKVACVLRLADASQIDARRAQPLHTPFRDPQGTSREHWAFQERMLHPRCDRGRLEFTSSSAFEASEAEAWWLAFDTISMIDKELVAVDSLCADLGKPRMSARGVAGAADPVRFARYVPTSGWSPIDARPHIRNPLAVIEALGGDALYGDDDEVPIREILANAYDASRARLAAQPGSVARPIQIKFSRDDEGDLIEIRDYGVGMSADSIAKYLCDFGSSGWRSAEFRLEYPGALATGYTSTGQYGIGFFSAFMIADEVTVISRPLHGGWADTHVLEFRGGVTHRPILRRATNLERLDDPGTLIRMRPFFELDEELGVLYAGRPLSQVEQVNKIRKLALTCSYPIEVCPLLAESFTPILSHAPWQEMESKELYLALHSDPWDVAEQMHSTTGIRAFANSLSELRSADGGIVGRLGFRRPSISNAVNVSNCYCGGFRSAMLSDLFGVASGKPMRANRDSVEIEVSIEAMQNWCELQWNQLIADDSVTQLDLLMFHWFSLGFGVRREDQPFCYFEEVVLSREGLVAQLETMHTVDLLEMNFQGAIRISGEAWLSVSVANGQLVRLPEAAFGVGIGTRSPMDEYPHLQNSHLIPPTELRSALSQVDPKDSNRLSWWNNRIHDPESEFIICLSEAWKCSIVDVLCCAETRILRGVDDDTRFTVGRIDGGLQKIHGLTFRRPISLARSLTT